MSLNLVLKKAEIESLVAELDHTRIQTFAEKMEAKESELINLQTENKNQKIEPSNIKVEKFHENHSKKSQIACSLKLFRPTNRKIFRNC